EDQSVREQLASLDDRVEIAATLDSSERRRQHGASFLDATEILEQAREAGRRKQRVPVIVAARSQLESAPEVALTGGVPAGIVARPLPGLAAQTMKLALEVHFACLLDEPGEPVQGRPGSCRIACELAFRKQAEEQRAVELPGGLELLRERVAHA